MKPTEAQQVASMMKAVTRIWRRDMFSPWYSYHVAQRSQKRHYFFVSECLFSRGVEIFSHLHGGISQHRITKPGARLVFVDNPDSPTPQAGIFCFVAARRRRLTVTPRVDFDVAVEAVAVAACVVLLFQGLSGGAGECISLSLL